MRSERPSRADASPFYTQLPQAQIKTRETAPGAVVASSAKLGRFGAGRPRLCPQEGEPCSSDCSRSSRSRSSGTAGRRRGVAAELGESGSSVAAAARAAAFAPHPVLARGGAPLAAHRRRARVARGGRLRVLRVHRCVLDLPRVPPSARSRWRAERQPEARVVLLARPARVALVSHLPAARLRRRGPPPSSLPRALPPASPARAPRRVRAGRSGGRTPRRAHPSPHAPALPARIAVRVQPTVPQRHRVGECRSGPLRKLRPRHGARGR